MAKSGGKQSYAQEKVNTQHEVGEISRVEHGQNEGEVESQVPITEKKNLVQQESASVGGAKNFRKKPTRTFNYGARRPMLVAQVFKTYEEAKAFMLERGISRIKDYQALQEQHDDLPKNPIKVYAGKWVGWNEFFGIPEFYTLNELQEVVRGLGLTTVRSYQAAQKKDPRIPNTPALVYKDFPGIPVLLGTEKPSYKTIEEAAAACACLEIYNADNYRRRRHLDPRLPKSPSKTYGSAFKNWAHFLGVDETDVRDPAADGYYATFEEFMEAVKLLYINSKEDYARKYRSDPKLPARPENIYLSHWRGWSPITQSTTSYYCTTWQQARELALPHRFFGADNYRKNWKVDARLPAQPNRRFPDFPGWPTFLLPKACDNMEDLKLAIKILKLSNQSDYQVARLTYPVLPENPEKMFAGEWKGQCHQLWKLSINII